MWLILMFMFVGMITPSTATAQETSSQLQKRLRSPIGDYSLSADTLLEALARIAAQFNLRMGIEWIGDTQHRRPIQLSLKNTTIDEVLRAALLSRAGYECSVQNDIVHIRPKAFLEHNKTFLDVSLESFELQNEYVMGANLRLMEAVRSGNRELLLDDAATRPSGFGGSFGTGLGDKRVSFRLNNVTVREVLDRLVLSADFQVWVVTYMPNRGITASGYPSVVSIFNQELSEQYQPIWDLLVRGFDPTTKMYRPEWIPEGKYASTGK